MNPRAGEPLFSSLAGEQQCLETGVSRNEEYQPTEGDAFGTPHGHVPPPLELVGLKFSWSPTRLYRRVERVGTTGEPLRLEARESQTADTISIVMSCGKGVTATCAHLLVERGLLDPDAPVAHYWPEFAANGKADIPVSYLLSHGAGLPSFPPESGIALNEMLDWNRCVTALAEMKPLWTPGTAFRYHQFTYGYLVGEVIRRISGKTVGRFFAEEVAGPLNLDLWIGLPEHEEHRVAPVFSSAPLDPVSAAMGQFLNMRETHAAEIPSLNGIGNARSLAKMYAAIIGEVDGVRLLSRDTVERARKPQTDGLPEVEPGPYPLRFALGYELSCTGSPLLGTGSFGHAGAGGRLGFVHPESGIAVGYVCNNMLWDYTRGPDDRWLPWSKALREVAGL